MKATIARAVTEAVMNAAARHVSTVEIQSTSVVIRMMDQTVADAKVSAADKDIDTWLKRYDSLGERNTPGHKAAG
ncbi:hypothetical protein [Poseidonocella sp. HB161398]|uniref:hypothetical protein n=1 Tax=Poseidonocella sp. HB161398 TaxID=2320855 RepID=UPI0014871D60|nr:hypothetical protein [Poseidonocella sp. HB161398]